MGRGLVIFILRLFLLTVSMICLGGGIYGFCRFPTYEVAYEYRNGSFTVAGVIIIFIGAVLLFLLFRTFGKGRFKMVIVLTIVISIPCMLYSHYLVKDKTVVRVSDFVAAPEYGGYEGHGFIETDAYLDPDKIEAYVSGIRDDRKRAQVSDLLEHAGVIQTSYEDYDNFVTRPLNELHNGDEILVEVDYDHTRAENYHIAIDDFVVRFPVEGLAG